MKRLQNLKKIAIVLLGLFACSAFGQSSFFKTLKLEATVVVKKHPMGSDLVELTILGSKYPEDAVQEKIDSLGKELSDSPRGVQISAADGQFVKASFAVNGLINSTTPKFNLVALARAMAFGNSPIRSFSVFFQDMNPDRFTLARYFPEDDSWKIEAIGTKNPRGLEYRIQVNTNDPQKLFLPGSDDVKPKVQEPPSNGGSKLFIFGGIIVGAIALGLLVYSALLRPRPGAR